MIRGLPRSLGLKHAIHGHGLPSAPPAVDGDGRQILRTLEPFAQTPRRPRRGKLDALQCFRGLAALGIVAQHATLATNAFVGTIPQWMESILSRGFLGVDFFFVLSGFIILTSHFDDGHDFDALRHYLRRRFLRIFPPFWPVSLAMAGVYLAFPGLSAGTRTGFSLLSSILLVPDVQPPALAVAWTLIYEAMFYAIFCLFYVSASVFATAVTAWTVAILVWPSGGPGSVGSPWLAHLLAPLNLEFIMGMAAAVLFRRRIAGRVGLAVILLAGGILVTLCHLYPPETWRDVYGIPFALLVLGSAVVERRWRPRLPKSLVSLGDASYSVYLVHDPGISVAIRLFVRLHLLFTWQVGLAVAVGAGTLCGLAYHRLAERRLIALCSHVFGRRPLPG